MKTKRFSDVELTEILDIMAEGMKAIDPETGKALVINEIVLPQKYTIAKIKWLCTLNPSLLGIILNAKQLKIVRMIEGTEINL